MTITHEADGSIIFEALSGRKFRFVAMHEPTVMKVWEVYPISGGVKSECLGGLRVYDVDIQTLKDIKVWDILSPEIQKEMEQNIHQEKQEVHGLMEKARAARRQKYINVPKELVCITCQSKISIPPGTLVKRVEKIAQDRQILFTVEDYVKQYQCQKCNPTKGKRTGDSRYSGIPRETTCTCGKKMVVNRKFVFDKHEATHIAVDEIIKAMKCRTCNPLKGRAANPALANLPKQLVCKCGVAMDCSPSYIAMRAKSKGVSPEKFIETYECQKCNPTKGNRKGKKGKK